MFSLGFAERGVFDWPHREASRTVRAGGLSWHVQIFGSGPAMLLLHGTGASSHSWRDVAPRLASQFSVIVPDLPGHGLTDKPPFHALSLPSMASLCGELLNALNQRPVVVAGHSAGAAILARMSLSGFISPRRLISINGALLPLRGMPGWLFSPVARLLASSEIVPRILARRAADPAAIARLVADTGSRLDAKGVELYRQLARRPQHVAAALGMMANWDLHRLERELPHLATPLALLVAANDRTISPGEAQRVKALIPTASVFSLGPLGHLAHEERPAEVARLMLELAQEGESVPASPC